MEDGSLDETKVVYTYCSDELSESLKYHLLAEHIFADSKDVSAETDMLKKQYQQNAVKATIINNQSINFN